VAMTKALHWGHVTSVQNAHEEIQIVGLVHKDFNMHWEWWTSNLLGFQMMRMIDKIVSVIGLRHYGDVVREIAEFWRDRFSLTIPRIESICRLADFDFTKIYWRDMIQESRASFEHGNQTTMIRGMQRRHDSSSQRLAWDPGIVVFDNSVTDVDEMVSFYFPEFNFGMLRIDCLEEWSFEKLSEFMELMIA
jgi:hypothetical protein